jgi:hypothetical protein
MAQEMKIPWRVSASILSLNPVNTISGGSNGAMVVTQSQRPVPGHAGRTASLSRKLQYEQHFIISKKKKPIEKAAKNNERAKAKRDSEYANEMSV